MIQANQLTKRFDDFVALDAINCHIPEGCIYGMVGSNGAGKSTFLRLITGVYKADSGDILIDGESVYENPTMKSRVSYVPDALFFLPGASMNRMATLYQAVYPHFEMERFRHLTHTFGLDPKKAINTFSKGMKRQAATILAIASRPKYIFFDETFDGLDPVMRGVVKSLICQDVMERGTTAIVTSHSLRELEDTCDQLALLHKGGLVLESDVQNLKTSLFKVQIAFSQDYDRTLFAGADILHFQKRGSVANLIVRGDREQAVWQFNALNPLLLDVLPLTLEEIFTYEMEVLGYAFNDIMEGAFTS